MADIQTVDQKENDMPNAPNALMQPMTCNMIFNDNDLAGRRRDTIVDSPRCAH